MLVGDVRHLGTLRALRTATRAPDAADTSALHADVEHAIVVETELLIEPGYFDAWAARHEQAVGVDVRLKHGRSLNELTRHRYDVIIHKGPLDVTALSDVPTSAWRDDMGVSEQVAAVAANLPVRLTGIPNPRLAAEVGAMHAVADGLPIDRVRALLDAPGRPTDPEELRSRADDHGCCALVTWSPDALDTYEAVLVRADVGSAFTGVHRRGPHRPLDVLTSNPTRTRGISALVGELRHRLAVRLPDQLVPSVIIPIESIPLTTSGKVDRAALPAPTRSDDGRWGPVSRNPREEILRGLFAETLGRRGSASGTASSTSAVTRCWPPGSSAASGGRSAWSCLYGSCSRRRRSPNSLADSSRTPTSSPRSPRRNGRSCYRSRSHSSACGSSTSSRAHRPPTTCRWPCE
jgi:pristinamycin I synthase-3/4